MSKRLNRCCVMAVLFVALACRSRGSDDHPQSDEQAAATDPCAAGRSPDPSLAEIEEGRALFETRKYAEAIRRFDGMLAEHPASATLRVWRAEATLYQAKLTDGKKKYSKAAADALPYYQSAEQLHKRGCRLPDEALYYLRMGSAYAHLRQGHADRAITQLDVARSEFPDSAEVTYALARAWCAKHEVERCLRQLTQTLELAQRLRRPLFLRTHRSVDEWLRRAASQSEFGPLRDDPRYTELVAAARTGNL